MPCLQRLLQFLDQGLELNIQIQLNLIQDSVLAVIPQLLTVVTPYRSRNPRAYRTIFESTLALEKTPQQRHSLCLFSQIAHEKVSNLVQTCQNVSSFSYYLTLLGKESSLTGIKQWKNAEELRCGGHKV